MENKLHRRVRPGKPPSFCDYFFHCGNFFTFKGQHAQGFVIMLVIGSYRALQATSTLRTRSCGRSSRSSGSELARNCSIRLFHLRAVTISRSVGSTPRSSSRTTSDASRNARRTSRGDRSAARHWPTSSRYSAVSPCRTNKRI